MSMAEKSIAASTFPSEELQSYLASYRFGHVIDGVLEHDDTAPTLPVIDPSFGKMIVEVPLASAADVDRAVSAARRALPAWRRRTPKERADTLFALAQLVDERRELFAQLESLNVGKPLAAARAEITGAGDTLRFLAGAIRTMQTPAADEYVTGHVSVVRREALGVVAAITPWNFPLSTAITKIAPALAAGCTVVMKPSELTPLTAALFADLSRSILPPGVLNVVLGNGPAVGRALATHGGVDVISMTGSVATGIALAQSGAPSLKHLLFELGGKCPVVIFDDADLEQAVAAVQKGAFFNCGQCCGAATRVLCAASVHDRFVGLLRDAVSSLVVGPPSAGAEMGPLVSEGHLEKVDGLVQAAVRAGATVETGGHRMPGTDGSFYQPTVLSHIPAGDPVLRAEIFGPVVTVETFEDEAGAIVLANDSDFGLVASLWTENTRRTLRVADALEYGTIEVNTVLVAPVEMPFGGFGMSGLGYENSSYSIDEFSRKKHVVLTK